MQILLQNTNISLYICIFCFKTAIFHYTYAIFASKQQYFIVHMHILLQNRNISLYICKLCGILPSSRPPGSIPAFFLPARNDPSILPARQDRSQHSSRPPGSIPAPLSACTMKYCYFELSAKCTCAFTCTFYVRVCMHLFVEIGLAR